LHTLENDLSAILSNSWTYSLLAKTRGGIPTPTKYDYNDHNDRKGHFAKGPPVTRSTTTRTAWTVAEAKAHFSEMMELAETSGPQTITRHGKNAVVVVSAQEWERKTRRKGSFAEFLWNSPLRNSGLVIARNQDPPRKIDL
jgi:prevent-host-death family protein